MKRKFGVSLEDDLIEKFDRLAEKLGFSNRSEALAHLIKEKMKDDFIEHSEEDGMAFAIVTICYDHHKKAMSDTLNNIQHDYFDIISSSLHIHIDHDNCAEMVVCSGSKQKITSFYREISEIRSLVNHNLNFIYNHHIHHTHSDHNHPPHA